jgi:hypothetical protein
MKKGWNSSLKKIVAEDSQVLSCCLGFWMLTISQWMKKE